MKVYVDIETYSSVDLRTCGVYRYAASPDFLILMAAWSVDGGPIQVDLNQEDALERFRFYQSLGAEFCAHNCAFERVCFSFALGLAPTEWLAPERFEDTQARAGELGFPQSLGKLAKALGTEEKDEAGTRLINIFCKPNRHDTRTLPEDKPMEWLDFIAYCEQDVATLVDVDARLGPWPTSMERDVFLADQAINDRGIAIDVPMARRAYKVGQANQAEQKERVRALTGVDNPGSVPQMMKWSDQVGLSLPNMQAETIERTLCREDLSPDIREVLELRQELALAAPAKFAAALNSQVDGRLRGTLKFFGAHTGRWAGRGTQVQNLPCAHFEHDVDMELAIHDLMQGEMISSEELKKLVRPMFIGPFTVVDYSAIEAVVIAWLAGEKWALEAFREGRDIYVETAARMGGLTRAQGKIACIAAGSKVLTDQGTMDIERVTVQHRVWDGIEWVQHDGVAYRGRREVMTYDGLTATPDHLVWIEGSKRPVRLDYAASSGARLEQTGAGGTPLWVGGDHQPSASLWTRLVEPLCPDTLSRLRSRTVAASIWLDRRVLTRVPGMLPASGSERSYPLDPAGGSGPLCEALGPELGSLRRSWNQVRVRLVGGSSRVGGGAPGSTARGDLNRPSRQRRTLRAGQPSVGHSFSAVEQPTPYTPEGVSPGALALRRGHRPPEAARRQVSPGDHSRSQAGSGGETEGLEDHRSTVAVYDILNAGPRQRFTVSGVLVHNCLALGYNGGPGSLRAMAGDNDYITAGGKQVLIRTAPDEVLYEELVNPWRDANRKIVQLWRILDARFRTGGPIGKHLTFERAGKDRLLRLPSGRAIAYRGCSIRHDSDGRERLTFASPMGYRADTYGGRLAENATQAVARDIMAEALVRLEARGYPVVGHIHDEILVQGEHELSAVQSVMMEPPAWAAGLPIGGDGYTSYRFKKG